MKKNLLIAFVLLVSVLSVSKAQNTTPSNDIKNRSIRIGYSLVGSRIDYGQMLLSNGTIGQGTCGLLNIDADLFRISNSLSLGAHLSFGEGEKRESTDLPSLSNPFVGLHYGIDLSYSILGNAGFNTNKWDLRLNGNVGSYWIPLLTPQLEYGAGISATFYPFKHFGIYGDLMWGHFLYNGKNNPYLGEGSSKIEIGVSYRF